MKAEKIILSFIAVLLGLLAAGVAFYFYQTAHISNSTVVQKPISTNTAPTPVPSVFLTLDTPVDEEVVSNKIITIAGKTAADAIVIVVVNGSQQIITPSENGGFSTTATIDSGENKIELIALAPDGQESRLSRTVTYSTEDF